MTATEWSARDVHALDAGVVIGGDGSEIGRVAEVYTDNDTGQPSWVTVKTGWFGTNESFVPLQVASIDGDIIRVPYEKDMIKGAPNNPAGEPLSESAERECAQVLRLDLDRRRGCLGRHRSPFAGSECRGG